MLVYGLSYPKGTYCQVGSSEIRFAVEHTVRDARIVINFIRECEMCFVHSLHKVRLADKVEIVMMHLPVYFKFENLNSFRLNLSLLMNKKFI